ncbi:hypothetical protein V8E53_003303 [Lactarius tabidus]
MTREQAQERLALIRTTAHAFQEQNVPQQIPSGFPAGGMAGGSTQQQMAAHPVAATDCFRQNFVDMPLQQLSVFDTQLLRNVEEGERNLNAAGSTGGESDMLDGQKQLLINIRDLINLKRQGGDPTQQAVNGAPWLAAQRAGLYSAPERPAQHNSPLNPSVNQIPPQRSIPTPQQNFAPSPPPQAPHPHPQQTIQCSRLPTLPEDRFKVLFAQFANTTGLRLNDRNFIIDNRAVNPWALHRAVFAQNGFDTVTANDEWPVIGAALGFPPFSADPAQLLRCAPAIAHRLHQLYNDALRHFEQAYINNVLARLRNSQALSQMSAQQQPQPHQPTEVDYQMLLANILQDSSAVTPEAISILPRFSHMSGTELEAHRVPSHIVAFVEQHRDQLQRAAEDLNGFRTGLTSNNLLLDNRDQD